MWSMSEVRIEKRFFSFQILARTVPYSKADPFLQGDPLDVFNANGLKTDTLLCFSFCVARTRS